MRCFSFFPRNEENYKDLCRLELRLPGHVMSWTVETRKRLFASRKSKIFLLSQLWAKNSKAYEDKDYLKIWTSCIV